MYKYESKSTQGRQSKERFPPHPARGALLDAASPLVCMCVDKEIGGGVLEYGSSFPFDAEHFEWRGQ
jgi:hypothetical protein